MKLHINTPLIESPSLSRHAGRSVWLKMEALQPPGSFKIRGIGLACMEYAAQGATRFISSSGGNAGLAVAWAGQQLGIPVTVVVPATTSQRAVELLKLYRASVIVTGDSWQEANAHALSLRKTTDAFLHPFDDALLWKGHATMIDEVVVDGLRPDAVILSVGGGGLLAGVVEGLQRNGLHDVPVIAAETTGAASLHTAIAAGRRVELDAITSVATSLGAKQVCEQAFHCATTHPVRSAVVSDREAVSASAQFLNDHRVLTEPACGASLACVYENKPELEGVQRPLVIVCGGSTMTAEQLLAHQQNLVSQSTFMHQT